MFLLILKNNLITRRAGHLVMKKVSSNMGSRNCSSFFSTETIPSPCTVCLLGDIISREAHRPLGGYHTRRVPPWGAQGDIIPAGDIVQVLFRGRGRLKNTPVMHAAFCFLSSALCFQPSAFSLLLSLFVLLCALRVSALLGPGTSPPLPASYRCTINSTKPRRFL